MSGSWCEFTSLVGAEVNKQLLRIRLQVAIRLGKGDSQPVSKLLVYQMIHSLVSITRVDVGSVKISRVETLLVKYLLYVDPYDS